MASLEGQLKMAGNVKIGKLKLEDASLFMKEQRLFALSVLCLMTAALYPTVPPNNPCMLCGLDQEC